MVSLQDNRECKKMTETVLTINVVSQSKKLDTAVARILNHFILPLYIVRLLPTLGK